MRADSPFRRGPLDRLADVELLTADWVHWYNTDRIMHRLGRIHPSNTRTSTTLRTQPNQGCTHNHVCIELRAIQSMLQLMITGADIQADVSPIPTGLVVRQSTRSCALGALKDCPWTRLLVNVAFNSGVWTIVTS